MQETHFYSNYIIVYLVSHPELPTSNLSNKRQLLTKFRGNEPDQGTQLARNHICNVFYSPITDMTACERFTTHQFLYTYIQHVIDGSVF